MALDALYLAVAGVGWVLVWGLARGIARWQAPRGAAAREGPS